MRLEKLRRRSPGEGAIESGEPRGSNGAADGQLGCRGEPINTLPQFVFCEEVRVEGRFLQPAQGLPIPEIRP